VEGSSRDAVCYRFLPRHLLGNSRPNTTKNINEDKRITAQILTGHKLEALFGNTGCHIGDIMSIIHHS
jgi:hypothetical protein